MYHATSKEVKITYLNTPEIVGTYVSINNPY